MKASTVFTAILVLSIGGLLALSGCASIGPPQAPSLELPKPPTDLHAARKADKVTLTWTIPARTTERQSVRYLGKTRICRSFTGTLKQCEDSPGDTPPPANFAQERKSGKKLTATFVDTLPSTEQQQHPTEFAAYAVEVLNEAGRGAGISNQVRVPLVPTLPPFADFAAQVKSAGVVITWQCAALREGINGVEYLFRIYRRNNDDSGQTHASEALKIADVPATSCAEGTQGLAAAVSSHSQTHNSQNLEKVVDSFLDQTFQWEKTYSYYGTVVSVINSAGKPPIEVEGNNTPTVTVFAHDVFPPGIPAGLQAVSSGPGQPPFIDLIWTPVTDADLAGYNVYRRQAGAAAVKMNSGLIQTPAFRDTNVVRGESYFYSVSAVDERGNESRKSEETSETVGQQ
jgi:hypothetical protein